MQERIRPATLRSALGMALVATPLLAASALGAGADQDARRPAATRNAAEPVELIPRELLFGNPERTSAQISPDGQRLAFLRPVDGVLNVWVGDASDPESAKPVTKDDNRGIRSFSWAHTGDHILFVQDKNGDENFHVFAVDLTNDNETTNLTPYEGARAGILELSREFPDEALVMANNRNPAVFDVHRVNIRTGESRLVEQNDQGFAGYVTDEQMNVRVAQQYTPDGGWTLFKKSESEGWEPFLSVEMEDTLTTSPVGFSRDGRTLYMTDSRDRNTAAAVAYDLQSGEKKVLAHDERADASGIMINPLTQEVEAVAFTYEKRRWDVLDENIRNDFERLREVSDGEVNIASRNADDTVWTVAFTEDDGPTQWYRYDRESGEADFLFTGKPALEDAPLANMHPRIITARDGLELVSYLTIPSWLDKDGDARPDSGPIPMVLFVHGGPWARDSWGYHPYHQWLSNRGYAVLSVNFRGSTGFGKDFINAGNMEWGKKMQDDLTDAVNWAITRGIAERTKVAIMGGSYGGYATLAGLTFTPDIYACGVDIVGPSHLNTLLESIPPYWAPMRELFYKRMGDPNTPEGRELLEERSPLNFVDRIKKPLLIGQGANDPRVKQSESDQIVEAMQEKEIPVTYVLFPDEGHGFARPENSMAFNAVAEAFLAEHLGGRFEPIGDDFTGSTIEIREGASLVPGVEQALQSRKK